MSCGVGGADCETPRRRAALAVLGLMLLIFGALSWFSFVPSRGQVTPAQISYNGYTADQGKRVFQAYNCMGCHTIVGNGAYFAPDLTREYADVGPAWLEAFLPSAGSWPSGQVVNLHLQGGDRQADASAQTIEDYYRQYPGAEDRVKRSTGRSSLMPNLPLSKEEVGQLIAYLKYTSSMDTEGWPPKVKVAADNRYRRKFQSRSGIIETASAATAHGVAPAAMEAAPPDAGSGEDLVARGASVVRQYGCTACHASDSARVVGPGWGGLSGSSVKLSDGSTATADDAYLIESIRDPDAKVVAGYPSGVMPAYGKAQLDEDNLNAIIAYLHSLGKNDDH